MLLTISTTHQPATDLGFLLHKHPDKYQILELSFGKAHLFYPTASPELTTICLLLDVDTVDLVRGRKQSAGEAFALGQYVNDRPYTASSFMSVAIAKAFSTALNGKCTGKPELAALKIPLRVALAAVAAPRGGEELIRKLFAPLGYRLEVEAQPLDSKFPDWGQSKYFGLVLEHQLTISELLTHLYVLLPALDTEKHYFISDEEIEKLLEKGGEWLKNHPHKALICSRYLSNLPSLTRQAMARLSLSEEELAAHNPTTISPKTNLHDARLDFVLKQLLEAGVQKVLDLGCGEGKLLKLLLQHAQFKHITGMDVMYSVLLKAKERLHYDTMSPKMKERLTLFQGSVLYRDKRLEGYEAAAVVEVIEHLEPERLAAFERVLFEFAHPQQIFLTTPNREYNQVWESLPAGTMRHSDHRFEWTRAEFEQWANQIAEKYAYSVSFLPVGECVEGLGAPTQMAVFKVLE
jgi:3' terminal RNA ribose 2'-O-methyltransferase Hen1